MSKLSQHIRDGHQKKAEKKTKLGESSPGKGIG
jgi:hypothetical protein